ncbi:SOS response-associated peptidase [Actinoalloteichus hymeniacidonis]|uniref:Abasic site processing protein n=1 Tax=Actinoalloteichus hymeniacidonis TaxID=340345 RepID=A0AAC9HUX1_9PSEU|nr:SOS response-associated peptidase [Actinoalloteichus hymeniacidonis]AOS65421.1 hypothetical protein TL08_23205 [Actinoalloteichus hymeniacidonis]MBB5906492.1 putative SOS response-associated peptidase YedK [Actinoalloteichus hymeniacidonis]
MCGRFASIKSSTQLANEYEAVDGTRGRVVEPDYNIPPTHAVLTVVARHPRDANGTPDPASIVRSIRVMRWGLVPHWAKDPAIGSRLFNARMETVADKLAFRAPAAQRRCLIPADGWYEWRREEGRKRPFYLTSNDRESLALAGIWSVWRDPAGDADGPPLATCTIVTTPSAGEPAEVHDRMPLVLPRKDWGTWLDPDADLGVDGVAALLRPPGSDVLGRIEVRPISPAVNHVRNNGPGLLERFEPVSLPASLDISRLVSKS